MAEFASGSLRFLYPDDWVDRSIFSVTAPGGRWAVTPNFVATKDRAMPGESLDDYVQRQLLAMSTKLERFAVRRRGHDIVSGRSAVTAEISWLAGKSTIVQRHVSVMRDEGEVVTFVTTSSDVERDRIERTFEAMIASVAL